MTGYDQTKETTTCVRTGSGGSGARRSRSWAPAHAARCRPSGPDLLDILAAWPIEGPCRLDPTGSGINKRTFFVETPTGGYVLCIYPADDEARARREHALLGALGGADLPFAVPAPLPARTGDTLVPGGDGLAALFPRLTGQPPDRTRPVHARAVGQALGQLHHALAGLELESTPDYVVYGTLERIHPRVPDPLAALGDLALAPDARRRLRTIVADLLATVPALYDALPRQLCHCDYGPGNTLVGGDRVSAMLDFEFAGPDLRAIDVATGWYWTSNRSADRWPPIAAFAAGYRAVVTPTAAELVAAPTLARLQRAVGLVHWLGRRRAGLADPALVDEQAERLLELDTFLAANADRLVATLAGRA